MYLTSAGPLCVDKQTNTKAKLNEAKLIRLNSSFPYTELKTFLDGFSLCQGPLPLMKVNSRRVCE